MGGGDAGLVNPDLPGCGAPAASALPHCTPAGAPHHLALGAPEPPREPFFFLLEPEPLLEPPALPEPFEVLVLGLHVQQLLKGNLPPHPVHTCVNSHEEPAGQTPVLNKVHGSPVDPEDHLPFFMPPRSRLRAPAV